MIPKRRASNFVVVTPLFLIKELNNMTITPALNSSKLVLLLFLSTNWGYNNYRWAISH
ncbi:hypothetical protein CH64_3427 [Yersinia rohdei]|uniref:Uncharacterized protein n=1 Tax=Yersinia rohdei TaxID=29485 RepID=A0A0U1HT44_YERRO|nr:hypothetical protein CH64_3427 [Yersinia rohdei]CNF01979.1 Uncharacterised protein [Yersinia rohdei]CNJ13022.1 Uncharacterised protein [Yersinia rohdei]CQI90360.1 Uncharacterised protein [Yersinia rohdei]